MRTKIRVISCVQWLGVTISLSLPEASAGTNLVVNGGFDVGNGHSPWSFNQASFSIVSYNSIGGPAAAVLDAIPEVEGSPGNGRLLRCSSVSTTAGSFGFAEQVIDLSPEAVGQHLYYGGYLGGIDDDTDQGRIVVRLLGAGDVEIKVVATDYVNRYQRNFEHTLLPRWGHVPIDPGVIRIAIRIEFTSHEYASLGAYADEIFAEVVPTLPDPIAHANGVELLENTGFEDGYVDDSPLTMKRGGWEGFGTTRCWCDKYSEATPIGLDLADKINGGNRVLKNVTANFGLNPPDPNASLRQIVDVRGDAVAPGGFDGRRLRIGAFLGGVSYADTFGVTQALCEARIEVEFLNEQFATVDGSQLIAMGPVTAKQRNFDTGMLYRRIDVNVPAGTAFIDFRIRMSPIEYVSSQHDRTALLDNVSAMFVEAKEPAGVPLGTNLIRNSGFDSAKSIGDSPLTMGEEVGWEGAPEEQYSNRFVTFKYGHTFNDVPVVGSIEFTTQNALGPKTGALGPSQSSPVGTFSASSGTSYLQQRIDLRGEVTNVDAGKLRATLSAWLGGGPSATDSASVIVRFIGGGTDPGQGGGEIGTPVAIGPVTNATATSTTPVLVKSASFKIPVGTRELWIQPKVTKLTYSSAGMPVVDRVSLVISCTGDCTPPTAIDCDSAKTSAMSAYKQKVYAAHSKFVKADPATQNPEQHQDQLAKAMKSLAKDFKQATESAEEADDLRTYIGTVEQLAQSTQTTADSLYEGVTSGMDSNSKSDRVLRASILALIGELQKKALKAEAKNIKNPDSTLELKRIEYKNKFILDAEARIAKAEAKGTTYTGTPVADLANAADVEVDAIVDLIH